jgi:hypothetical protein
MTARRTRARITPPDPGALSQAKRAAVERYLAAPVEIRRPLAYAYDPHPEINVVGVGIGLKLVEGRATDLRCVRFYVERKLPLPSIPEEMALPPTIAGVLTDVIETGLFRATLRVARGTLPATERMRPAGPGCSIGVRFKGRRGLVAGTLGAIVRDHRGLLLLSNNHVIADENRSARGASVLQPGPLDGGITRDRIATLERFVPLRIRMANRMDAAVARIASPRSVTAELDARIGPLASGEPLPAREGQSVGKVGRGSGFTRGRIGDVSADIDVHYDRGVLRFRDQILIESRGGPFSEDGDSGALIVGLPERRAVGLLSAGSPVMTVANPIGEVLERLGIVIVV